MRSQVLAIYNCNCFSLQDNSAGRRTQTEHKSGLWRRGCRFLQRQATGTLSSRQQ